MLWCASAPYFVALPHSHGKKMPTYCFPTKTIKWDMPRLAQLGRKGSYGFLGLDEHSQTSSKYPSEILTQPACPSPKNRLPCSCIRRFGGKGTPGNNLGVHQPATKEQCSNKTTSFWVNYSISLTWYVGPFGDDFPEINHDSSEGEQWGRYNLPRSIH
jgi:hypothetical protein